MKKILPLLLIVIVLVSCSNEKKHQLLDKKYGGTLRITIPYIPKTLYPAGISDVATAQVVSQIHAGLVKFNAKNLAVVPSIARKWKTDSTSSKYTFYLRKDVYFHNDECFLSGEGRKVTTADVLFSLEKLCTQQPENQNFNLVKEILGAKKYFDASAKGKPNFPIEGIKIENDSIIQITLEKPNPYFINFLANPACAIIPKEAVEKYGYNFTVGAGPFSIAEKIDANKPLQLVRFDKYFLSDDKNLFYPYLDSVKVILTQSSIKEFEMFYKGNIDVITGITPYQTPEIMEKHIKEFEAKPPKYILSSATDANVQIYNLSYPYVKDFFTNSMNYIDLSVVYIDKSPVIENK